MNLEGLTIVGQEKNGSTIKLTLDNGQVLTIYSKVSCTYENNFNLKQFNGKNFNEKILNNLENQFFSLENLCLDMSVDLKEEDIKTFKIIIEETEEDITLLVEVPVDTLKGKTINWEDDWYENHAEEIVEHRENVQEVGYVNLSTQNPKDLYEFLVEVTS